MSRQTWAASRAYALSVGAELASIHSAQENEFVKQTVPPGVGTGFNWIGLQRVGLVWQWSSGEAVNWFAWHPDEPNGTGDQFVWMYTCCGSIPVLNGSVGLWNDTPVGANDTHTAVIEWDTDCNGDGVVDYGQIVRGELADLNGNGVPDVCETSISSVIPPSVPAQGGSAITIRGNGFPQNPAVLIGGVPATNVVRVSSAQITATTPALLPGMASVSVSGFTLVEGVYIRPECGSDLDQDGEVTASDIAIVLLDFGPCYATAASSQPADSTPFLLKEEPISGTADPR
jgi:hypothetical protein